MGKERKTSSGEHGKIFYTTRDKEWFTIEEMRAILHKDMHDFYSKLKKGK